ncbi:MAG: 4-hydroxythreonine-4-phosphate dehydrogenase PdxA [Synergistaceae bacterium]|nr:4-hydroxythreonine-4-phosphate dehydrogenase PdxA [Synergistaceae bacterium]
MKDTVIAVPMGDPAGVGPEIALKSIADPEVWDKGVPLLVGDLTVLEAVRNRLGLKMAFRTVDENAAPSGSPDELPVVDLKMIPDLAALPVGKVSALAGEASVAYIRKAVELCGAGKALGIATTPINKEALRAARAPWIGHTEMLADMSGAARSYTMFLVDKLRILFHSRHLSLKQAIETLDASEVLASIEVAAKCLESIGLPSGTIALAALNPHASDGGLFGDEEARFLIPAVEMARKKGINAVGPVPADSVFYFALQGKYAVVVSLYHDQGHIASKTYDFYRTVSVTFGLPFIRTSVDHGTAFDIAWQGKANPVSMTEAHLAAFAIAPLYRPF